MRITYNTMYSNIVKFIDENYDKLNTINEHVSSGKKINNLSDAPLEATKIVRLNKKLNAINQYSRNITTAGIWLKTTDSALMQLKSLTSQVRQLATQAASDTYNFDQRKSLAVQIDAIADNVMEIANTDVNGKYIFSGFKVNKKPFEKEINSSNSNYSIDGYSYNFDLDVTIHMIDSSHYEFKVFNGPWIRKKDGTGFEINSVNPILGFSINSSSPSAGDDVSFKIQHVYKGDNGKFKIDVDKTQKLQVNKLGSEVFTTENENTNIFRSLGKIWAGMITNNRDLIEDELGNLPKIETNLLDHDAEIGLKQNLLENFKTDFIQDKKKAVTDELSEIQDTDIAEEMTLLAKQQIVYQATLKTASIIANLNILNFI